MEPTVANIGRFLEGRARECGRDGILYYSDMLTEFPDLPPFTGPWPTHPLCDIFGELDVEDASRGLPFRTALVISPDTGVPGNGFFTMYVRHRDPRARVRSDLERIAVHQRGLAALAQCYENAEPSAAAGTAG